MSRGVVILALGHPYWGDMAVNLATSIKKQSDVSISLLYGGEAFRHFNADHHKLFNNMIPVPNDNWNTWKAEPFKAKTHLYDLTPYDKTLYLDADMIWLPWLECNIDRLLDRLNGTAFTAKNNGPINRENDWIETEEVKAKYGNKDYYDISTELMYWEQGSEAKSVFEKAKLNYVDISRNNGLNVKRIQGCVPDEVCFSIAFMQTDTYPKEPIHPVYWEQREKRHVRTGQKLHGYYAYSMGGATAWPMQKEYYEGLVRWYAGQTGIKLFQHFVNKRDFTDRGNI